MKIALISIAVFCSLFFISCEALELLGEADAVAAIEEGATMTAFEESALADFEIETWGRSLTKNELLYNIENDVRAVITDNGNPRLYLIENNKFLAEVVDRRTIRFANHNEINLRENIYALKAERVNLRNAPTVTTSTLKRTLANQKGSLVLVTHESEGFYKVYLSKTNESGWISKLLLFPILVADSSVHRKNYTASNTNSNTGKPQAGSNHYSPTNEPAQTRRDAGNTYYDQTRRDARDNYYNNSTRAGENSITINNSSNNSNSNSNVTNSGNSSVTNSGNSYNNNNNNNHTYSREAPVSNNENNYREISGVFSNPVNSFSGNIKFSGVIQGNLIVGENSNFIIAAGAVIHGYIQVNTNSTVDNYGIIQGPVYLSADAHLNNYATFQGQLFRESRQRPK